MSSARGGFSSRLPRLWTLLLALNLLVLILPLAAIIVLRTYDRQLIRQTEAELFVQGALVVELARDQLAAALGVGLPPSAEIRAADSGAPEKLEKLPIDSLRDDIAQQELQPNVEDAIAPTAAPGADDLLIAKVGAQLTRLLERASEQTLAGIRIVDTRGVVVATSRSEAGLSIAARSEVQAALQGHLSTVLRRRSEKVRDAPLASASRNTGVRVFVALPIVLEGKTRGAVILARTPMTLGKAFYQDRYDLLLIGLAQLAAVLALSLVAAGVVIRPVRALAAHAQAIADGRDNTRALPPPRTYEVALLADSVARMGTALQQRADAIRAFAANVSHELKTPLTSLGATVELLQDQLQTMEPQQRARFLEILAADAARLNLLVDRLLELARAEVVRPGASRAELSPLLESIAARERTPELQIQLQCEPALFVQMAPELLDAAIANLIANAKRHGEAKQLWIRAARSGDSIELVIENDGKPISAGNRARIFDAFFTTAREQGGTGMGLTIVQSLLQAHRGTIALAEANGHVAFRIELPEAREHNR